MKGEASSTGIYVRLVVVAIVWGASFIAGRVVSTEMDAVTAALWRYVVAIALNPAATMVIGAALVVSGVFIINRTPTTSTAGHHACSHTG